MQSRPVITGPRDRVLTRSRSLALPLGNLDLSLPSDGASGVKGGAGGGEPGHQTKLEPRKDPKKSLRRQKSFAELFGVVIYKSKVQLHELFSRREKDFSRNRKKEASPIHGTPQTEAGAAGGSGVGVTVQFSPEPEGAVGSSETTPSVSPGRTPMEQLAPRAPTGLHYSIPDLTSRSTISGGVCSRTPEKLFCVTGDTRSVERPASTRSLDTIHGGNLRAFSDSKSASFGNTVQLLKPDKGLKTKTALVKCNSDSICRLVLPLSAGGGGTPLTKASSDDACFIRRLHSPQLVSRDSNINLNNKTRSSISSPQTSTESLSCISSIVDWLLVGSIEAAYNEPLLCSLKVEAIVDITNLAPHRVPAEKKTICPCTCSKKHFRSKLNLAVDDIEWENIEQHFNDINTFISGWRQSGKRVLVVSYHGKSRAPAVAVQHIMTYFRIPLERALAHVRSRRLQTRINPGFLRALQRLEKRLAEEDSAGSPPSPLPDLAPPSPRTAWDEY